MPVGWKQRKELLGKTKGIGTDWGRKEMVDKESSDS